MFRRSSTRYRVAPRRRHSGKFAWYRLGIRHFVTPRPVGTDAEPPVQFSALAAHLHFSVRCFRKLISVGPKIVIYGQPESATVHSPARLRYNLCMTKPVRQRGAKHDSLAWQITELQLWHAFDVSRAGLKRFDEALARLCPFKKRIESLGPTGPSWDQFVATVRDIYERNAPRGIDEAARQATRYVMDLLSRLQSRAVPTATRRRNLSRRFGCFRYDLPQADLAELHFSNAARPESPFKDLRSLAESLRQLCADIRRRAPGVQMVCCGSWINNLRAFRRLFPESYIKSLRPTDPDNKTHAGWWGQFITHDGKLNQRRAKLLKTQRRFEFEELEGQCTLQQLEKHLDCLLVGQLQDSSPQSDADHGKDQTN